MLQEPDSAQIVLFDCLPNSLETKSLTQTNGDFFARRNGSLPCCKSQTVCSPIFFVSLCFKIKIQTRYIFDITQKWKNLSAETVQLLLQNGALVLAPFYVLESTPLTKRFFFTQAHLQNVQYIFTLSNFPKTNFPKTKNQFTGKLDSNCQKLSKIAVGFLLLFRGIKKNCNVSVCGKKKVTKNLSAVGKRFKVFNVFVHHDSSERTIK